jgi:hypothetical protein
MSRGRGKSRQNIGGGGKFLPFSGPGALVGKAAINNGRTIRTILRETLDKFKPPAAVLTRSVENK